MSDRQFQFPMPVAVCAWCEPQARSNSSLVLSHGICLRHLKKVKLEQRLEAFRKQKRSGRKPAYPAAQPLTLPLSF